jgi:hypothetical protein
MRNPEPYKYLLSMPIDESGEGGLRGRRRISSDMQVDAAYAEYDTNYEVLLMNT